MRMSLREKTKKDLVKIVGEGLAAVVGGHGAARRPLGARNVDAVSRGLVDRLL